MSGEMGEFLAMVILASAALGAVTIVFGFVWSMITKKTGWIVTGAAIFAGSFLVLELVSKYF